MCKMFVPLALLASLAVIATADVAQAQPYRRDFSNGIRDAAAKANGDQYYFYTREAVAEEGPLRSMLGGPAPVAAPATLSAQRSFSRAPATTTSRPLAAPSLSIGVIRQHAADIHNDLVAANQTYANLSNQYKNNPAAEKYLSREHEHRQAALAAIDRLQAESKAGRANSRAADADARRVQSELAAASVEHSRFRQSTEAAPAGTSR